jgi:hypothetical protein
VGGDEGGRTSDVKCAVGTAWPIATSTITAPRDDAAARNRSRATAESEPPVTTARRRQQYRAQQHPPLELEVAAGSVGAVVVSGSNGIQLTGTGLISR